MNTLQMIEVMQAYLSGKKIEYQYHARQAAEMANTCRPECRAFESDYLYLLKYVV